LIINLRTRTPNGKERPLQSAQLTYAHYGFTYTVNPRKLRQFNMQAGNRKFERCLLVLNHKEAVALHNELDLALYGPNRPHDIRAATIHSLPEENVIE